MGSKKLNSQTGTRLYDQGAPMKLVPGTFVGTALIAALVGAGLWYARDPEGRQWPLSCLSSGAASGNVPTLVSVKRFEWSADGEQLLALYRGADRAETHIVLHDLASPTSSIPMDLACESASVAAMSRDGRHILLGTYEGRLRWVEPARLDVGINLLDLPRTTFVTSAAITNDGRLVAAGTNVGSIYLWNWANQTSALLTTNGQSAVRDLRFSGDGRRLLVAQSNGRISVWDAAAENLSLEFAGHDQGTNAAEFLFDGQRISLAGLDDTGRIWDIDSGRELWRGEFGLYGVTTLAVAPDGKTAAWGGYNRKIIVWDLERFTKRFEIPTSATSILH